MEFGILGPLEVRDGDGAVRVPGAKERALLADLLVDAGRVVSADRLIEDLWGETRRATRPTRSRAGSPSCAGRSARPGRAGGARPPATCWTWPRSGSTRAGSSGWSPRPPRRPGEPAGGPAAEEALGLWRGPALAEFAAGRGRGRAARLEELRLAAAEALAELGLAAGGHAGLVGELEALWPRTRPGSGCGAS